MSTYATSVPGAANYAQAQLLANTAYGNAMARLKQQRGNTLLKYGYRQNQAGGYEVDPNNEYGSYQQLLKGEAGADEGLQRNQAASGWGGSSGFLGAQREGLDYQKGAEQASLGQDLSGQLTDLSGQEQEAAYTRDASLYQAQLDAAQQAINDQNFNPGDYSGLDTSPDKPPVTPAKKAAPKRTAVATHRAGKAKILKAAAKKRKAVKR